MNRIKNKKIKYGIISLVAVLIFGGTVAYAALNKQLRINGDVTKKGGTWQIYMSDPQVLETSGSGKSESLKLIDENTLNISASLTQPGDSVTYTFKITNGGTVNAQLYSWGFNNQSEFTALSNRYNIETTLTYDDETVIIPGQDILAAKTSRTFKLTFTYNGLSAISGDDVFLSLDLSILYSQVKYS